jgi:hypothetical protein
MFKNLIIISQFNKVVKDTIEDYSQKYNSIDIQLFLVNIKGQLDIQILCDYKVKETIHVDNLKFPALITNDIEGKILDMVEGKILNSLENFKPDFENPKCMLLIKNGDVKAFLYDNEKPIKQIDTSKII